jgi:hypothetical protein
VPAASKLNLYNHVSLGMDMEMQRTAADRLEPVLAEAV